MKIVNKFLYFIIAFIMILSAMSFIACGNESGEGGKSSTPAAKDTITDALNRGELTNTLHKINVKSTNNVLVSNAGTTLATTEYTIVADVSNSYSARAANFISGHLTNASYANFGLALHQNGTPFDIDTTSKYIIIGCKDIFDSCGLSMPEDNLGPAGYYIKTFGNNLFLEVEMNNGYQMGAISLLKAVVGYDMIAHDTVVYDNNGSFMPEIEIIERPDYDYRNYTNWMTKEGLYGMGYEIDPIFVTVGEGRKGVHNIFEYLPLAENVAEHPGWFSVGATQPRLSQLCYTARGNEEEYELMQEKIVEVMYKELMAQPNQNVITLTSEDNSYGCTCEACTEVVKRDGALSATVIRFLNGVDEKLQEKLLQHAEENGEELRQVQIAFFAYHAYYSTPTTHVSEDPTLKCSPNVTVFIAPIDAKYIYSFYDETNRIYADTVKRWSEYTDNIMAWVYEADYHHYMFPYNTYSAMVDTYYFFKQNGANIMYNEGQRFSENVTCFGKLKEYLDSKAQVDVTVSYGELKDKFFKYYYGAAADIMEQYYNELRQWETYLESVTDFGLGGGIYQEIGGDKRFWPKKTLENWIELMDKAAKAVAYLELENPQLYAKYIKHINIEKLFPEYALCTLHEASYTPSEIKEKRIRFKELADELGVVQQMEHGYITDVYRQWGLI